jgi:hypothetical protein
MILPVPTFALIFLTDFDPNGSGGVPQAPQHAFAINTSADSLWFKLGVNPTDWIKIGSGSGGGGTAVQVFRYTVTGAEPDLSEIAISLPTPTADASYEVIVTSQGVARIPAFDVHSKTTTGFILSVTGDLVAGDVIGFAASHDN